MVLHRRGPARAPQQRPGGQRPRSSSSRPTSTIGATRRLVGVVVLAGVLEDLLHGAGRAGQEDDPGVADLEQDRLAGGVAEVLGDRGREDVGRLVAVVPGRDAEASRAPSGDRSRDLEGGRRPGVDRRAGTTAPPPARRAPRRVSAARASAQPRAEVRRLHRARAAAGGDGRVRAQGVAEPGGLGVAALAAAQRRARPSPRRAGAAATQAAQRLVDRVVVQGARPAVVARGRARSLRPGVGAGVERVGVRRACRTARRRCRARSGRSRPGRRGSSGRTSAPRRREPLGVAGGEGAAQEGRPGQRQPGQRSAPLAQVERSRPASRPSERAPAGQPAVEAGQRTSMLDDAAAGALHAPRPTPAVPAGLRTRGPAAPRTAPARRRRAPGPGTRCTCSCSRAAGSPCRRVADQVDDLGQVDDDQPLAGGQDVVRRQVAVDDPVLRPGRPGRRAAGRSTTPAAPAAGGSGPAAARSPPSTVIHSIRISVPSICTG